MKIYGKQSPLAVYRKEEDNCRWGRNFRYNLFGEIGISPATNKR